MFFRKKKSKRPKRNTNNSLFKRKRVTKDKKILRKAKSREYSNILQRIHGYPDLEFLILVGVFLLASALMMFSASNYYSEIDTGDVFFYFKNHLLNIGIGIFAGYVFFLIPIDWLKKYSPVILGIGVVFLLYILPEALFGHTIVGENGSIVTTGLQMPFVEALNGAPRWINFPGFNFQPSEYVKFAFIIYISAWLANASEDTLRNKNFREHLDKVIIPFMVLLGFISLMILAQRDFDTTVILILTILAVYYTSGKTIVHTLGTVFIMLTSLFFGTISLLSEGYRRSRVAVFLHMAIYGEPIDLNQARDEAFQSYNGLVAQGSGGLFGSGYDSSIVKQGYLQEASYTDSIFAVIGEEFGFVGSVLVIIGYLLFAYIGFRIANNAKDKFSTLLATGLTTLITLQAFLNIASVQVLIPFGGMPLPFFTYGGTTTIMTLISVGVLLNISKQK